MAEQNVQFGSTWTKVRTRVVLSVAAAAFLGGAKLAWTDRASTMQKIESIAASQKAQESDARVIQAVVAARLESLTEKVATIDEKIDRNHAESREDSRQIIDMLSRRVAGAGGQP